MYTPSERGSQDPAPGSELIKQLREQFIASGTIISIAGSDGTGKTTLAGQLADVFTEAGLPVRRIHCHAWFKNLFIMPFRLAQLKSRDQIIILDRSIFDNIIEFARKAHLPGTVLRAVLSAFSTIHSRFDHKIVLWASLENLIARRPNESREKLEHMQILYSELTASANYRSIEANGPILSEVLKLISSPNIPGSTHGQ